MQSFLEKITDQESVSLPETKKEQMYRHHLSKRLSKEGQLDLLCMVDEMELRAEKEAYKSFQRGFALGLELAADVFWRQRLTQPDTK